RFVCTTDDTMAQIATFYAGAMSEARMIELGPIHQQWGLDLVLIGADDPEAMLRHTEECRARGIRFVADPSQQLAFADGPFIRRLIDGADYLFTNEYESHLTQTKTGWTQEEIDQRVTTRVITRGEDGADIRTRGEEPVHVPIAGDVERVDPTGVGDAFRAGFLVGLTGGLSHERCAQMGSVLAAHVLETVGTQEYVVTRTGFLRRVAAAYGDGAAEEIGPLVRSARD
ncbi:MAG: carbohydrate kinase family protein, partial [Ornithinibacter sp.]|nr:carbohydrate kinase family protein [Ornithinibacter sp.]